MQNWVVESAETVAFKGFGHHRERGGLIVLTLNWDNVLYNVSMLYNACNNKNKHFYTLVFHVVFHTPTVCDVHSRNTFLGPPNNLDNYVHFQELTFRFGNL